MSSLFSCRAQSLLPGFYEVDRETWLKGGGRQVWFFPFQRRLGENDWRVVASARRDSTILGLEEDRFILTGSDLGSSPVGSDQS
ncbi:hypothetical protein M0R45_018298 [Rubus argutus]|uniref:Uncharacterized protein n=1 Tax=Rubus argutus TaxID=59490 RepID=A0AAW1X287_RUBAR